MTDDDFLQSASNLYWAGNMHVPLGQRMPSLCSDEELLALKRHIQTPTLLNGILEIGTAQGGTTVVLMLASHEWKPNLHEHILTIDPLPFSGVEQEWGYALQGLNILGLARRCGFDYSTEDSDGVVARCGEGRFRFVLVDGCHEGEWPMRDLLNAVRLLAPGGVVAMHDVGSMPDPTAAWEEVLKGEIEGLQSLEIVGHMGFARRV
jgi:predicted O-methyltransferase YrrM